MSSTIFQAEHVSKHFGNINALIDVSLEIKRNEIVGLLGQNGSGKSTLTKVMVGVEKPDEGRLSYLDAPYAPKNPLDAARRGVSIAYQESATVPDVKVFEWIYLGREMKSALGILRIGEMKKRCASTLNELGVDCKPEHLVRDLSTVTRKMIEIARAIQISREGAPKGSYKTPLIILDEPTAPLTDTERGGLYSKLAEIKEKSSLLLISHLIPEVLEAANRVYVLRDGRNAGVFDLKSQRVTEQMIYRAMFGEEMAALTVERDLEQRIPEPSSGVVHAQPREPSRVPMLRVTNISLKEAFSDVSFELKKGEVICIDGSPHSGKAEIVKTIAGIIAYDEGTIEKDGRTLKPGIMARIESGIGYFSGERSEELFLIWPVIRNITVAVLNSLQQKRWIVPTLDNQKERRLAEQMVHKLGIHPPRIDALIRHLSGGNMQKVGLAKWLSRDPDILILVSPTIGIDTKTKFEIFTILQRMRADGKSIILVSEDPEEVRRLSDRILRVENGRLSTTLTGNTRKIE